MSGERVAVLGGGIIGLACADELVRAGHRVTVLDPAPASGATRAAAGMLAPAGEAWFGEEALLRLGIESAARWPAYAASLESRAGIDVDMRSTGTLVVACDQDDLAEVRRSAALVAAHGVSVEELGRREARRREPTLGPRVAGAVHLPDDHQVNPRRVAAALLAVLGDRVCRQAAVGVCDGGVRLEDGALLTADVVVLATGSAGVPGVRPVRGEIVVARSQDPPRRVLRARVHGERVYVVPRAGGEVVVGATEEEHPAVAGGPRPTLGGLARLLAAARTLLPGLETAEVLEVLARDRPGSPDNGPILGPAPGASSIEGAAGAGVRVIIAGGHYRGGVLLAPVTAAAVRAYVDGTAVPEPARPFAPDRFCPGSSCPGPSAPGPSAPGPSAPGPSAPGPFIAGRVRPAPPTKGAHR